MQSENWARNVGLPVISFVLGVITTALLEDYLKHHDVVLLVLIVLSCFLLALTVLSIFASIKSDRKFSALSLQLGDIASATGLHVSYVEDGPEGESYRRVTELIKMARESLTFVDMWEPFEGYQTEQEARQHVREQFYASIIAQIEAHRQAQVTFHRRIVQVPDDLLRTRVPFEADPMFREYLLRVCGEQRAHPRACRLKIAPVQVRMHFIIIDRQHIVMPVLSNDTETRQQKRHGALFFDDRSGDLYKCLVGIYQAIDAHSRAVEAQDLSLESLREA
jgi:hypothetical protein